MAILTADTTNSGAGNACAIDDYPCLISILTDALTDAMIASGMGESTT